MAAILSRPQCVKNKSIFYSLRGELSLLSLETQLAMHQLTHFTLMHRQTSHMRRTKTQHFNVSRLILQLSLPNPLKPSVISRMKM